MKDDFSSPQRQSLIGVIVMFADTMQGTVRALWPMLVVLLLKADKFNKAYAGLGILTVVILVAVIAYLKYLNFTFFLDRANEEFIVRKGILNKKRIAISLHKIQHVNINQSLIQRIIGVYALEVDTAGTGKTEVAIRAISHGLATHLKGQLLEGDGAIQPVSEENRQSIQEERPFIEISPLSLLKTGITSNYTRSFALLTAFVFTSYQYADDYFRATGGQNDIFKNVNTELVLQSIAFIILAIIFMVLVINLGRTLLRYFNFRITRQQHALLLSYGLINTKNTIIKSERVQTVTVGSNYFQKKLDIQDVRIRQASDLMAKGKERQRQAMEIPGCNEKEKNALLAFLLGRVPEKGAMMKPSYRKLLMKVIKTYILPFGIYFTCAETFAPGLYEYKAFIPFYVILTGILIYFGYRNYRLFVNDEFIIKQSGAWDIDNEYLEPHKIQSVTMTQYFWHKYSDIGIVTLHTAGGNVSFGLANYTQLKQYTNYWLYQVETTDKDWM